MRKVSGLRARCRVGDMTWTAIHENEKRIRREREENEQVRFKYD